MDAVFDFIQTVALGFFWLIGGLFVLAVVFGKRMERKWEYEAEFRDESGKEIGELDVEMSREKGADEYEPQASLVLKHASLAASEVVQVFIGDELVLEGSVARDGRVRLTSNDLMSDLGSTALGQICTVRRGDETLAEAPLARD